MFSDDGNYVIPNINSVVTGGTHQLGDWDTVIKIFKTLLLVYCVNSLHFNIYAFLILSFKVY